MTENQEVALGGVIVTAVVVAIWFCVAAIMGESDKVAGKPMLQWERIAPGGTDRLEVHGGWIVEGPHGSLAFVPDSDHVWTIEEKEEETRIGK